MPTMANFYCNYALQINQTIKSGQWTIPFLLISVYVHEKFNFTLCLLLLFGDQEVSEVGTRSGTPGRRDNSQTTSFVFYLHLPESATWEFMSIDHKEALLKKQ